MLDLTTDLSRSADTEKSVPFYAFDNVFLEWKPTAALCADGASRVS